ncbi:MAG: hypothetical protein ACRCZL_08110 [Cetobacterium sp.]
MIVYRDESYFGTRLEFSNKNKDLASSRSEVDSNTKIQLEVIG